MDKFPYVKICFLVEGKKMNLKTMLEELEIFPTETREIDDWPESIKNNANLPEELQPRYVWSLSQEENLCKKIELPIYKIVKQLAGKEQKLMKVCKRDNLRTSLCIIIHAETMNLPEITLPADIVSYFGKLEVEIAFDIYIY